MNFTTTWLLLMVFIYEQALCEKEHFFTNRCFPTRNKCKAFCITACRQLNYQRNSCWKLAGNDCSKTYKSSKHSWLPWICGCAGHNVKDTAVNQMSDRWPWYSDVEGTSVYKDIPETEQIDPPLGMPESQPPNSQQ